MKLYSLASSSSANAYIYAFGKTLIGIDIGLNKLNYMKKIEAANIEYQDIAEFFITHEHIDHIRGLKVLQKNSDTCINLSQGTFDFLDYDVNKKNIIQKNESKIVNDVVVEFIRISHDANEPLGFIFHYNNRKYVHLLDTGYISTEMQNRINGANFYLIESNYEEEALITNPKYPLSVKKRILSDRGHLSNKQCHDYLHDLVNDNTDTVCFGHLSEKNNEADLITIINNDLPVKQKIVLHTSETTVVTCK